MVNIVPPQEVWASIHSRIMAELRAATGSCLQQSEEAPALVTSVNLSSVVAEDIRRDLGMITGRNYTYIKHIT